jgi:hypothetical protein
VLLVATINMKSRSEVAQLLLASDSCWVCRRRSCFGFRFLVFQEVTDRVHFFVWNADNINAVAANEVEHHMLTFGEAVIAFTDIRAVFAQ